MIKFFRKIRQNLLMENKTGKYFKYAIGEIVLVVIGILIALSINNWNERKKLVKVQIDILKGISNDLTNDTIEINSNIRHLENIVHTDSLLINHLIEQKTQSENLSNWIITTANSGTTLNLHTSFYNEAKVKGLAIIKNRILRAHIGKLYEFDYNHILDLETTNPLFQFSIILRSKLYQFISLNRDGAFISNSDYSQLIMDKKLHYELSNILTRRGNMLRYRYIPLIEEVNETLELISKEIESLEKK